MFMCLSKVGKNAALVPLSAFTPRAGFMFREYNLNVIYNGKDATLHNALIKNKHCQKQLTDGREIKLFS